jgi:copper chaperone CopZ
MLTLLVDGMTCQGCARAVSNAVGRVVSGPIEVDLDRKEVRVPDGSDLAAVVRAVEDAGYDVRH